MTARITPFLWFNDQAEEAATFYTSIFPNSKINSITRFSDAGPGPKGSVMTVDFLLDGQRFTALNGGPHFTFSPAISFVVHCKTQQEVDQYWDTLSAGGATEPCGWLKDRYGVSWQVVPTILIEMLQDRNPAKVRNVMQAVMKMVKLDIQEAKDAYEKG